MMTPSGAAASATLPAISSAMLSFSLAGQTHGIAIARVREIRAYEEPTPVAHLPQAVLGVHNLRGAIVPVVDLRQLLRLPRAEPDALTVMIMLELHGQAVAAVVDAVCDVIDLPNDGLGWSAPRPADNTGIVASVQHDGHSLKVLDIDHLFAGIGAALQATDNVAGG